MASKEEIDFLDPLLRTLGHATVIELGAHHGNDTEWILASSHAQKYVAAEPDPRNREIFQQRLDLDHVFLYSGAVCGFTGRTLFRNAGSNGNGTGSGSIRRPKEHLKLFPQIAFGEGSIVPCSTLDDLAARYKIEAVDFMWWDVQGAERDVISGGKKTLAATQYLFTEFEDVEMYEGQANRTELLRLLSGFAVVKQFEDNVLLRNKYFA